MKEKISITLDEELIKKLNQERGLVSLSVWINNKLNKKVKRPKEKPSARTPLQ